MLIYQVEYDNKALQTPKTKCILMVSPPQMPLPLKYM